MDRKELEQEFLRDVAEHTVHVFRDEGVYRHIRFGRERSSIFHFHLITWPGHLCYTGDMGTFVFSRVTDMFQFFRMDEHDLNRNPHGLSINPGYWSEKILAADGMRRRGGSTEFSYEKFRNVINKYRIQWIKEACRNSSMDKAERRELWEEVQDEILDRLDEGEHALHTAARDFSFRSEQGKVYYFEDLWDHNFEEYTCTFMWCCFALAWGIKKYDEAKTKKEHTDATSTSTSDQGAEGRSAAPGI